MQTLLNDVTVNEVPLFLSRRPDDTTHVLQVLDPMDNSSSLIISFSLKGIVTYLSIHKPTIAECKNEEKHPHNWFTAEESCCNTENSSYAKKEEGMVDIRGQVIINPTTATKENVMTSSTCTNFIAIMHSNKKGKHDLAMQKHNCCWSCITSLNVSAHDSIEPKTTLFGL